MRTTPIRIMALIVHVLILGICIQPLRANNSTVYPSATADSDMPTVTTLTGNMTSTETGETVSTQNSTDALAPSTDSKTGSSMPTATPESTTILPGSTVVAAGSTATAGMTDVPTAVPTTTPMQLSTGPKSISTVPSDSAITTMIAATSISTSSMTKAVTSVLGGGLMTTSGGGKGGGPAQVSLAVYIAVGVVCGLVLLVVLFGVGVWCRRRRKSSRNRNNRQLFGPDEMDKLSPKDRMSMHRPNSATVNAEEDLAFVTFGTGGPGAANQVDGIENPTYAMTTISDEGETAETTAGAGDQNGAATLASTARLSVDGTIDGAVHDETETGSNQNGGGKDSKMRPQSGVSYSSVDIDGALETLDIATV